jgi:O-antigen/teichoic acid export membrane protein
VIEGRRPDGSEAVYESEVKATSRRVAGGVAWNYAGSGLVIVSQIVYTAFTARLLTPVDFGAYASALALIALMGYFSLATLGNALTRARSLSRATVGTALCLATAAGVGSALVTVLLARPWASVWKTEEAERLILLWAPGILLSALAVIPLGLLRRRLRYAEAAAIESISPVLGFVVGGALVLALRSPSALVAGQVVTAAFMLLAGVAFVKGELGRAFSKSEARGLLSFSTQVTGQNLTHYGIYTLPGLVIARSLGSAALGFYSRANLLVMLPMNFLTIGISKSLYPVIPQLADIVARRRALADVSAVATFLVWPLLGILAGSAGLAVDLLFGAGWEAVASMVPPLCLFAAANLVYAVLASATESIGWLRVTWIIQAVWVGALGVATLVAWQLDGGARTYLYAFAFAQIAVHFLQLAILSRMRLVPLRSVVGHEIVGGLMALISLLVTLGASDLFDDASLVVRLAAAATAVALVGITILATLPRVSAGRALARRGLLPRALARTVPHAP